MMRSLEIDRSICVYKHLKIHTCFDVPLQDTRLISYNINYVISTDYIDLHYDIFASENPHIQ